MNTTKRRIYLNALKVFNLALLVLAFTAATLVQVRDGSRGGSLAEFLEMRVRLGNVLMFCAILVAWHVILSLCGLYHSQRLASKRTISADAMKATTLASLFLAMCATAFHIKMITPVFVVLFWLFGSGLIAGARIAIRYGLETARVRGHNLRYILILGTNRRALEFAKQLDSKPELGYRILGFVDESWHVAEGAQSTHAICCDFQTISEYLRHNVVDEVANYLPLRSFYEHCSHMAGLCEQHGIFMRFDPDIFDLKIARARAEEFDGNAHITAHSFPLEGWSAVAKRVLDIAVSMTALLLLSPILLVVSGLVKLTSQGSILFRQERIGRNKRRFLMYKFRTMVPNAEKMQAVLEKLNEAQGPVFKIKNDPRITPIGRWLRRTSLDELPQLVNVLKGDMSLVGPRPLPVRDYQGFSEDWQRRRFSIRPGITCLWQVNGRSNIAFDQWMRLDLQYLDEWSIWLDFKILAQTVPAVLKGSGAA